MQKVIAGDHPIKKISLYDEAIEDIELINEAGIKFSKEKISKLTY